MRNFEGSWNKSAEVPMARIDEQTAGLHERMVGVQTYVNELLANDKVVSSLIHQDFVGLINNNVTAAEKFARENQYLIPSDVRVDGMEYQIAFIMKLAEELAKPEYNQ